MFSTKEVLTTEMLFKNCKMKNISKSQVLTLKDEVAYQDGMVVSKTLVQNDAVKVPPDKKTSWGKRETV